MSKRLLNALLLWPVTLLAPCKSAGVPLLCVLWNSTHKRGTPVDFPQPFAGSGSWIQTPGHVRQDRMPGYHVDVAGGWRWWSAVQAAGVPTPDAKKQSQGALHCVQRRLWHSGGRRRPWLHLIILVSAGNSLVVCMLISIWVCTVGVGQN